MTTEDERGRRSRARGGKSARPLAGARVDEGTPDRALVARLRVRDEAAFREFHLRFRPLVMELACGARVPSGLREEVADEFLAQIALNLAAATAAVPERLASYVARSFSRYLVDRARERSRTRELEAGAEVVATGRELVVRGLCSEAALRASAGYWEPAPAPAPGVQAAMRLIESETTAEERELLWWVAERVPQRLIAEWLGTSHAALRVRVTRLRARLRAKIIAHAASMAPDAGADVLRVLGRAETGSPTEGREDP